MEQHPRFFHRINERGEHESACRACFEVVTTQQLELDLAKAEGSHLCQEMLLQEALNYFRSHHELITSRR